MTSSSFVAPPMETISSCRACGSSDLETILAFGDTPLADGLIRPEKASAPPLKAPLTLAHCNGCGLGQILETVSPSVLFGADYPYYSSVSPSLMKHFADSASALIDARGLGPQSLVIEAASNDGYMLRIFHEAGIPTLGIDPAPGPAAKAVERGIPTLNDFFTRDLAARLAGEGRRADVFLANNVLAHVADLNGFVAGIATLLAEDGVAVIECPYLIDLVDHCEFDTIYHQHLCYFSVTALKSLFGRHGLHVNDVARTAVHGGSLRVFVSPRTDTSSRLAGLLQSEAEREVMSAGFYADFRSRTGMIRTELHRILDEVRAGGARVVGYGAAAKATTFLQFVGLDSDDLDYVVDRNVRKHGWVMPGALIPIVPSERLLEDRPDYLLILAWNFAEEIMSQETEFAKAGGRFIVPIPHPRIVAPASSRS